MKKIIHTKKWGATALAMAGLGAFLSASAQAGDIFLTGHDVDLHGGQAGYDYVILNYLSGGPSAAYDITVIGTSGVGSASWTTGGSYRGVGSGVAVTGPTGYGTTTFYDAQAFAALGSVAQAAILGASDLLLVLSAQGCGGCSLTPVGSAALATVSAEIATAFNAGMDIWGNSGDGDPGYYGFLPPTAVATGTSIGGSTGFTATAAGAGIGIVDTGGFGINMANGYPTHNKFDSYAPAFTVMETRRDEIVSLGLKGGTISTGVIVSTPDTGMTLSLLGLSISGMAFFRRKFRR